MKTASVKIVWVVLVILAGRYVTAMSKNKEAQSEAPSSKWDRGIEVDCIGCGKTSFISGYGTEPKLTVKTCVHCDPKNWTPSKLGGVTMPSGGLKTGAVITVVDSDTFKYEAPSVADLVATIWASALDVINSDDFKDEVSYLKARAKTLDHYSAKINRLITEARIDEISRYHGNRGQFEDNLARLKELLELLPDVSNNLSKGDSDG